MEAHEQVSGRAVQASTPKTCKMKMVVARLNFGFFVRVIVSGNGNYEPHTHISAYESSVATLDNEKTSFSQHLLREAFGFGAVAAFLLMV